MINIKTINNTRIYNSKKILEAIMLQNNEATLSTLNQEMRLNVSTVKRICDVLVDEGAIVETISDSKTVGRNKKIFQISSELGNYIVVILGTKCTRLFICDSAFGLVDEHVYEYEQVDVASILQLVAETLKCREDLKILTGVVITSGIISTDNTTIIDSKRMNCTNFNVKSFFREHLNENFLVENNMKILSLYHLKSIKKISSKNFAILSLGTGIGMGIVLNNQVYRGDYGGAGEVGHIYYKETEHDCYCGRNGCYEMYLSDRKLLEQDPNKYIEILVKMLRTLELCFDISEIMITGNNEVIFANKNDLEQHIQKENIKIKIEQLNADESYFRKGALILAFNEYYGIDF